MIATEIATDIATDIAGERQHVVETAATWLGTSYHPHGRVKGVGVDCGQLLLLVFAEAELVPAIDPGYYAPDWHLHRSEELYLGWVERWCVPTTVPRAGDIALFRFGRTISHGGVVVKTRPDVTILHAYHSEGVRLEEVAPHHRLFDRLVGYWTLRRWADAT